MGSPPAFLITCEHGGNRVPAELKERFAGSEAVLATHRAMDPGALELARRLAARLEAPLVFSRVTRLVVDLNRSQGHRSHFSEFTRDLDRAAREAILAAHYWPYRHEVQRRVADGVAARGRVLHVSVHTFTPRLNDEVRRADVAFLYDPSRQWERSACKRWIAALESIRPELVLRRNYPYLGTADGLTTWLRRRFGPRRYAGIELEVSQRWPLGGGRPWRDLQRDLVELLTRC